LGATAAADATLPSGAMSGRQTSVTEA
jgi:hypothetical protein